MKQKDFDTTVIWRAGGWRAVLDRRLLGNMRPEELARTADRLMLQGKMLKDGHTSAVGLVRIAGQDLVIKRSNWRGWMRAVRYGIFGSRARRSWIGGRRMKAVGLPTPEVLGYVDQRRFGLLRRTWLLQAFADGPSLLQWLTAPERTDGERRTTARKMIGLIKRLHTARITFGDLKQSNVLVVDGNLVLIDLDGTRVHWTRFGCRLRRHRDIESLERSWRRHPDFAEIFNEALNV